MENEIKIGDRAKDVCGDVGEVVDIEYDDNGEVWSYTLADDSEERNTWKAHPVYTYKIN